ncbi:MAG: CBS domain-containing protein [Gammaproteobacteria bacterium]|nr:CBS domain-containing protein [Gammaproteobacteria bacterium]
MRDVSIERIMTTDPITIGPYATVVEARSILQTNDMNHLPVVEQGKLVGIMSTSDLLRFSLLEENAEVLNSIRVRQVMQVSPHVLAVDENLRRAADKLSSGGFHALPVIEPDRTLVGIVTSSDLIEHLLRQIPTGDGSIRSRASMNADVQSADSDVSAAIKEIEQASARGDDLGQLENALLTVYERNRRLDAVFQAAERYVRSGHADHEHSVLLKRLSEIWDSAATVSL